MYNKTGIKWINNLFILFTLSIANAKPDGLIKDTIHNARELELESIKIWIKYNKLKNVTAKFPKTPAV